MTARATNPAPTRPAGVHLRVAHYGLDGKGSDAIECEHCHAVVINAQQELLEVLGLSIGELLQAALKLHTHTGVY